MITLRGRASSQDITLQEALKECHSALCQRSDVIALLYSPAYCQFAKLKSDGILANSKGNPIDPLNPFIFEARIFNEDSELRWLNQCNGQGQAAILSAQELKTCLDKDVNLRAIATLDQYYLLWGKVTSPKIADGWTRLATSRIGALDVPLGQVSGKRVRLKAIEYLTQDNYGNLAVVEERLVKLEVAS